MLIEAYCGFSLCFAPGWANGWPGLSIHTVWSAGMSSLMSTFLMMLAIDLGAVVGLALGSRGIGLRYGWFIYSVWLLTAAILITFVGIWLYDIVYADALKMWPNGYPNR